MIINVLDLTFYLLLFIHLVVLTICIYNLFTAPMLKQDKHTANEELKISVLIPARNEEKNIKDCLDSIFNSTYKNFEVIVLDDNSIDSTFSIIENYKSINNNLKIIKGILLPEGWFGKNWACHQLSENCTNEIMLFVDADVRLERNALGNAVDVFMKFKADLLSVFPTQKIKSAGEWLLIPLMDWLLYTFLPLKKVYTSNSKSFSAANGQFLMIKKDNYKKFGGHEKLKNKVVEDVEFVRSFKKMNFKTITLSGNKLVYCRMYRNLKEVLNGFSKNFYPGFNIDAIAFMFLLSAIFASFFLPIIFVFIESRFLLVIGIILIQRLITSSVAKQNLLMNLFLFFPHMLMIMIAGIKSFLDNKYKRVVWKDRKII